MKARRELRIDDNEKLVVRIDEDALPGLFMTIGPWHRPARQTKHSGVLASLGRDLPDEAGFQPPWAEGASLSRDQALWLRDQLIDLLGTAESEVSIDDQLAREHARYESLTSEIADLRDQLIELLGTAPRDRPD